MEKQQSSVENLGECVGEPTMINQQFWENKKVFVTGHTGFKGSWLCMWLSDLGAKVTGFALPPSTNPSLFELCKVEELIENHHVGDIRDLDFLISAMKQALPDIVIHMAAQPLVRESYKNPVETYSTNVMGTVHMLEAVRQCKSVKAVLNVTTDKCYENKEWVWGYRETEPLGGFDPYSSSKACSELVTSAYRNSFFGQENSVAIASARAGNVIGGGDWANDRLIPDCVRSLLSNQTIKVRNPDSIRPWQHVLEPLSGYLMLLQHLYEGGSKYADAWNFGPLDSEAKPVKWIVEKVISSWTPKINYEQDTGSNPHEAHYLKLDCSKAFYELGWQPRWSLEFTIEQILAWTRAYMSKKDMRAFSLEQIKEYTTWK